MRITIAAIAKDKSGTPQSRMMEEYLKRLPWQVTLKELEEKKPLPAEQRKAREAELLLGACEGVDRIIALDERGKDLSSQEFATKLENWTHEGAHHIAIVIGGQDGLDGSIRSKADLTLCFGRMTWPHMLVRPLLAEQLYRAYTILTGHPYHRE